MSFYKVDKNKVKLNVLVKPNKKESVVLGVVDDRLVVAVDVQPHKGAANKELIACLAAYYRVPKSCITILKGHKSRYKQVEMIVNDDLERFIE